ncbi:MAG: amylo-alpha-1,6-glucosidase [Planctomycetota bacterium]
MLTLQKADNAARVSVSTGNQPIEDLLTKEWLLTNERGSYASSTIVGCNARAYHGLLIGSLRPPVNRVMALANCLEMLIFKEQVFNLSTFEFGDKFAPAGFSLLKQFRRDIGVHFDYELKNLKLTKSVYLLRDTDTVALVYDFTGVREPAKFVLRPFVGLRDYHTLQKSYAPLSLSRVSDGVLIRHDIPNSCELLLNCPSTDFEKDRQWWFNFIYRNDRERGQDFTEDLWTPGFFRCWIDSPTKIVLWASLNPPRAGYNPESAHGGNTDIDAVRKDLRRGQVNIKRKANSLRRSTRASIRESRIGNGNGVLRFETLCSAADQFITTRNAGAKTQAGGHDKRVTILAGYPWFADWGRDAFIALPGLLLSTGRFDEAKSVLVTFAAAADEGMIPNRFDDRSDTAHFNSVDASFWFVNAAFRYLEASGDSKTFMRELMPAIRWIIDSYHKGTRFGIRAEADGLITAGNDETQLTWMDAKYDGTAFTPRCGKAVEVNALWYNCLCLLAQFYAGRPLPAKSKGTIPAKAGIENANHYKSMADKVQRSFCELFWNQKRGYLNDCISPDGSVDESLRPNQIFAVSLPFSPLSGEQQKSVVDAVQKELLTPYGLRTLNIQDTRYKGQYTGPQQQRDEAYHQGTVWPYLIGAFVESFLKVNQFSRESRQTASEFIQPLLQHLTEDGCLWSVSEIFDGDAPHKPRGCIAQAWSVAELIRAYQLINS